jgi:hypothetical protein
MPDPNRVPRRGPIPRSVLDAWSRATVPHFIAVSGSSMLPLVRDGDHVLVAHGFAGVRRGDIVVLRREGRLIAHRVLRIYGGNAGSTFITKGDSVYRLDPPSSADQVLGRVLAVRRKGRHLRLDTPAWRMFGWLIAVKMLACTQVCSWGRKLKRRLLGPRPNGLTAFLRRSAMAFFSVVMRTVEAIFCRWRA